MFKCNGPEFGPDEHFFVPFDEKEVNAVISGASSGAVLVYGQRQAGKTSFGSHVCKKLVELGGPCCQ
jgi:predicted AAA+ superfamily ATPase